MTPRERMLLALKNKPVDRVPVALYIDFIFAEFLRNTFDVDLIKDCFEFQKQLGFDVLLRQIPIPMEVVNNIDCWKCDNVDHVENGGHNVITTVSTPEGSLRSVLRYYDRLPGQLPSIAGTEFLVKSSRDFEIYVKYNPEMKVKSLDNMRLAAEMVGDSGIICPDIGGAFNYAVNLRGVENLIMDALTDEVFYKFQMEYQVKCIKCFIDGISDFPGDMVRHYDNEANGSIVGASFYEKYVLPYEREIITYAENKGIKVMLHNCGVMGQLLECYPDTGASIIESFCPPPNGDADFEKACRLLEGKMVRVGGIDQIHLLKNKDKDFLAQEIERLVECMKGSSGYIACTTDELDRDIPIENILLYRDVAMRGGKY